jgi:radical SAM protein with 4Fe4S-binding SPASM domain
MLKIRPEPFGGIVFNTRNGVKLFVDHEGFSTIQNFIKNPSASFTECEKIFLQDFCHTLNLAKRESYLICSKNSYELKNYSFRVLTAPFLVDLQITNKCNSFCQHCYAESSASGSHLSFSDIINVLDNCAQAGVFEIALGGGEPTLHPRLVDILKAARKRNLVCNLATNGKSMNSKLARILAKYCGAVALSIEFLYEDFKKRRGFDFGKFLESVMLLKKAGLRLVFQVTVSCANIYKIKEIARFLSRYKPYGIVFLAYKPLGRGKHFDLPLSVMNNKEVLKEFEKCFIILEKERIKIGYDCCMGSLLTGLTLKNNAEIYGCSATRESIGVNMNLDVLPCSFASKERLGNLRNETLLSIWHNHTTNLFRNKFENKITNNEKCKLCRYRNTCLGGCPIFDLVRCE